MADDALAKAGEAIGGYVYERYCTRCANSGEACSTCPAEQLRNEDGLNFARAVLEAVGIKEIVDLLRGALRDAKDDVRRCAIYRAKQSCEPCRPGGCDPSDRIERIEAVLRRLGEEG